jgi:hypothetical protein
MRARRFAAGCAQAVLKGLPLCGKFLTHFYRSLGIKIQFRRAILFRRACERRADSQDRRRSALGVDNGS